MPNSASSAVRQTNTVKRTEQVREEGRAWRYKSSGPSSYSTQQILICLVTRIPTSFLHALSLQLLLSLTMFFSRVALFALPAIAAAIALPRDSVNGCSTKTTQVCCNSYQQVRPLLFVGLVFSIDFIIIIGHFSGWSCHVTARPRWCRYGRPHRASWM